MKIMWFFSKRVVINAIGGNPKIKSRVRNMRKQHSMLSIGLGLARNQITISLGMFVCFDECLIEIPTLIGISFRKVFVRSAILCF